MGMRAMWAHLGVQMRAALVAGAVLVAGGGVAVAATVVPEASPVVEAPAVAETTGVVERNGDEVAATVEPSRPEKPKTVTREKESAVTEQPTVEAPEAAEEEPHEIRDETGRVRPKPAPQRPLFTDYAGCLGYMTRAKCLEQFPQQQPTDGAEN